MSNHEAFYGAAEYYDIAFDFKNVGAECDFLEDISRQLHRAPESFIELAAGPALHAIEMAKRGRLALAVDLSPSMVEYGTAKAAAAGADLRYLQADMVTFSTREKFDLAAILMDSAQYLLDNDSFLRHLRAVADCLNEGGLYILEMGHPRDLFGLSKSAGTEWGHPEDGFDPTTQIANTSVRLEYWDGSRHGVIAETAAQRRYGFNELDALVTASDRFQLAAVFGAMKSSVPFTNEKEAWRMVPVLKRTA